MRKGRWWRRHGNWYMLLERYSPGSGQWSAKAKQRLKSTWNTRTRSTQVPSTWHNTEWQTGKSFAGKLTARKLPNLEWRDKWEAFKKGKMAGENQGPGTYRVGLRSRRGWGEKIAKWRELLGQQRKPFQSSARQWVRMKTVGEGDLAPASVLLLRRLLSRQGGAHRSCPVYSALHSLRQRAAAKSSTRAPIFGRQST